jgi:peptide/nickel transport system substrate-binding protein
MVDVNVPRRVLGATGLLAALRPGRGMAQVAPLRIGALTDPSMDPHFLYLTTNMAYSQHLFDALSVKDENSVALHGLAESWRPLDERRWEFVLRRGVKFHDGSELTAADVKFSIERVTSLPANPAPYTPNLRGITEVEILDDHRLRFTTSGRFPRCMRRSAPSTSSRTARPRVPRRRISARAARRSAPAPIASASTSRRSGWS